jgi:hypothetical protein
MLTLQRRVGPHCEGGPVRTKELLAGGAHGVCVAGSVGQFIAMDVTGCR